MLTSAVKSPVRVIALAVLLAGCLPGAASAPTPANPALVDDVAAARLLLEQQRTAARVASQEPAHRRARRLIALGLFQDADSLLARAPRTPDVVLTEAELRFQQHRFAEASALVAAVQTQRPGSVEARHLAIGLAAQAWQLDWAQEQAESLLRRGRRDPAAGIQLGRILLLRRDLDGALEWARRVQDWRGGEAAGHRLEADVHLAANRVAAAEVAFQRALALDPLDADARFSYGYALWRRGAPALLPSVRDQWELALELDPLHLPTHWFLGNELAPASPAAGPVPEDSAALAALAYADTLLAAGELERAIGHVRAVEGEHPASRLPALWLGSLLYLRGVTAEPSSLDSAQVAFRTVLSQAHGSAPAHNGVAAVLRQRQFRALAAYDSLEAAIALTPTPAVAAFSDVFPGLASFPGEGAERLVAHQLGPLQAFLPMLERQGQRIRITSLHHYREPSAAPRTPDPVGEGWWVDLHEGPQRPEVEIGVHELERGSHLDDGILLGEVVRLVYANLFTDAQQRRVRALYREALEDERLLDYRAATSEQAFLARAVEAFMTPVRTHPLDPGSMNTRADLERTDPATYAFVEEVTGAMERALAGDAGALRSNRAQMYVGLAREARGRGGQRADLGAAAVLLDSALIHDSGYLPAMLEYALLEGERGRLSRAHEWIAVAAGIDPAYTPLLVGRAALLGLEEDAIPGAAESRVALLRQAAEGERDPQLRAEYVRGVWELQEALGWLPEAIFTAEEYVRTAPATSPPLIAARDRAELAVWRMRVRAGYPQEAINQLRERVAANPSGYDVVGLLADALTLAGQDGEARRALESAGAQLAAAGATHPGIQLRLAELDLAVGDSAAALARVEPLLAPTSHPVRWPNGRLARLLISLGQSTEAQRQVVAMGSPREPAERAEQAFTRGWISAWRGDHDLAEQLYWDAIREDRYHLKARLALVRLLRTLRRGGEAQIVVDDAATLPLPLGPAFVERAGE